MRLIVIVRIDSQSWQRSELRPIREVHFVTRSLDVMCFIHTGEEPKSGGTVTRPARELPVGAK